MRLGHLGILVLLLAQPAAGAGMPADFQPDLSRYRVTDPNASYFDVAARAGLVRDSADTMIMTLRSQYGMGIGCAEVRQLPVADQHVFIPAFHAEPEAWREATEPLRAFEDAVSGLAAAYVATGDAYNVDCLVEVLNAWAERDALMDFDYQGNRQSWYNLQSVLFAAGLAYSVVHAAVPEDDPRKPVIEDWLVRASRHHISFPGDDYSCCNNHFYRRALHATVIGIVTENDQLFRYGLSAAYLALTEMNEDGSLPRQLERGSYAVHYQNYALLYLIPIFELATRQGYPFYDLDIGGHTIHDAVGFTLSVLDGAEELAPYTPDDQDLGFAEDEQYFAWMEIYSARFANAEIAAYLEPRRPLYNRSAGGPLTLYFYQPATAF